MSILKSAHQRPRISIKKSVYAMATTDSAGDSAEITMYGDSYEEQPTNWWGEPIEGQYILLSEFLEDLKQISSCKNITIRMNSYGGDAGASNMIHNACESLPGAAQSSLALWMGSPCLAAALSCAPAIQSR